MSGFGVVYAFTVKAFVKQLLVYLAVLGVPYITGATISYVNGDDAWWNQHLPFPLEWPRYWPLATNYVRDSYSGLSWIADPSQLGGIWGTPGTPAKMSWTDAIAALNELNYAGHNDWRMPNTKELESILDFGRCSPTVDGSVFKNTADGEYYSSSVTNFGCENMYIVDFSSGNKSWDQDPAEGRYVRPVRGSLVPWWSSNLKVKAGGEPRSRSGGM
jgi:hypothetical protein